MIETENLSRAYGGKTALHALNLRVSPGEILGFLGPNGAGKSTTVKILTGMIKPDRGRATVAGFDVASDPLQVKTRVGYVPESAALSESLSARRVIADGTSAAIAAAAGAATLEQAFVALTGTKDAAQVSQDLLQALER